MRSLWLAVGLAASSFRCGLAKPSPPTAAVSAPALVSSLSPAALPGLRALGPSQPPGDPGPADVRLDVRTDSDLRRISPLIYGTNQAPEIARTRQSLVRYGGNRWSAYNWENNASNAGSDYHFQNDGLLSESEQPAESLLAALREAEAHAAATLVTVPILDQVAADKRADGDVRSSGSDYLQTRFHRNFDRKPSALAESPDPHDRAVYQDELVAYLRARRPRTPVLFSLDNEPDLWSETHAELHPQPLRYAELWDRNLRYARAIKRVWPDAPVLGFVSYGWNGFVNLQRAPDARGRDFIDWYLAQARAEEAKGGRLIDYLDLHWYPEAYGGKTRVTSSSDAPEVVAARLQAPRSLWDPGYDERSWIRDDLGEPIALLPRMAAKIAAHYPGTRLAISEWNYGAGQHVSGALASADVLGIFGRQGVGLAAFWPVSADERFSYAAFRAYRNYDGQGGEFGDISLPAATSDVAGVTVYASLHSAAPGRVVIIAICKSPAAKSIALRVAHPTTFRSARRFELTGAKPELVAQEAVAPIARDAWLLRLPPFSLTVLALE